MTMQVIYTITVFNVLHQRPELTPRDQRCWCWCPTEQEARDCLQGDGVDLYFESGTYQLAVIEEVPPFLMGGGVEPSGEAGKTARTRSKRTQGQDSDM